MVSSVRIDGSLPDPGDSSTRGLIFSGGWGVDYDFAASPALRDNWPQRLSGIGFPAPFDRDLEGALRGRGQFSQFLYLFKNARYLRLAASTMAPAGPPEGASTAANWGLPTDWVGFDAVLPGRGRKIDFCYFFRGNQYIRFEWNADDPSAGYPWFIGPNWHLPAPFDANVDGVIAGQGAEFTERGYVFARLALDVDDTGDVARPGQASWRVLAPAYARYDFNDEAFAGQEDQSRRVTELSEGLLPLLDAGPAIDTALLWCDAALAALRSPATPGLSTALGHHFMNPSPSQGELNAIFDHLQRVRRRIDNLPVDFQWTKGLPVPAQTRAGTLTEIGDDFSNLAGPNGRAATLIHEAVHFIYAGGMTVDVPEWSGATVNGREVGVAGPVAGIDVSGIAYRDLTTTQAIENPSSHAAFAQEMFFRADMRFGAARPHE